ncbi:hypothetical protein ScPMuIL_009116 [Solemya velum]
MASANDKHWSYRGEGNRSLVVANSLERRVYRLSKVNPWLKSDTEADEVRSLMIHRELQMSVDYIREVIQPLLSARIVPLPVLSIITRGVALDAEKNVQHVRPAHRKGQAVLSQSVDPAACSALVLPDLCFVASPHGPGQQSLLHSHPTVSVEIKPKKAFIPSPLSIEHENSVKCEVCKFCLHQRLKAKEGQWPRRSRYCPLELFSGDRVRMKHALLGLVETPQNNLKICLNGEEIYGAVKKEDLSLVLDSFSSHVPTNGLTNGLKKQRQLHAILDLVIDVLLSVSKDDPDISTSLKSNHSGVNFPQQSCRNSNFKLTDKLVKMSNLPRGCVLERVLSAQRLDELDIDGVVPLYEKLELHLKEHPEDREKWCLDGPYTGDLWLSPCLASSSQAETESLQTTLNQVKRFLISKTVQDCSIMVAIQKVQDRLSEDSYDYIVDEHGQAYHYSVSIIDLDPKPFDKIPSYRQQEAKILKAYKEATENGDKCCL